MAHSNKDTRNFGIGFGVGVINAVVFNPADKALYTMMKRRQTEAHVSLFDRGNWVKPYQGVHLAIGHRVISYGLYFPFIDFYRAHPLFVQCPSSSLASSLLCDLQTGIMTGATTAFLLNPVNLIKTIS